MKVSVVQSSGQMQHSQLACWVLALLVLPQALALIDTREDAFIGWKGESYKPNDPLALTGQDGRDPSKKAWVEVISWKPRAFVYHNFLTVEEAVHLKRLAAPTMRRSTVVAANGSSVTDDYRTSYGTFIKRKADSIVERVEERVANWVKIPPVHHEDMQVLRYGQGQYYKPHMDVLKDDDAGPRVATLLLYLNNVQEGGETAFPDKSEWVHKEAGAKYDEEFSACAKGHVGIKPKLGDALMFWSVKGDYQTEDARSMHTGCPVLKGIKWTATKWVHARPFRPHTYGLNDTIEVDPGDCKDAEPRCAQWASAGECTKNKGYMVGDVGNGGKCRLSCKACQPCAKDDRECFNTNRRNAGYLVFDWDELANSSV